MLSYIVSLVFRILCLIILIVVLLSWIPIFDVKKEPIATLVKIYEKIMKPFRNFIPPIGAFDITPIVAIILIQILGEIIIRILLSLGL